MCVASARLFFGLTVPALDLVVAANAWPARRRLARTINGIALLRESGRLKVKVAPKDRHRARSSPASVLHRVPGEVWQLIKVHLMAAAWEDAEHALVWRCHNAGRELCKCRACVRAAAQRTFVECTDRVLRLEEFGTCDACDAGFVALGGGEGLLDLHRTVRLSLSLSCNPCASHALKPLSLARAGHRVAPPVLPPRARRDAPARARLPALHL